MMSGFVNNFAVSTIIPVIEHYAFHIYLVCIIQQAKHKTTCKQDPFFCYYLYLTSSRWVSTCYEYVTNKVTPRPVFSRDFDILVQPYHVISALLTH